MLSFGNMYIMAAQISARSKSSFPFYEKMYTYVSPRVSDYKEIVVQKRAIFPDLCNENMFWCGLGQLVQKSLKTPLYDIKMIPYAIEPLGIWL